MCPEAIEYQKSYWLLHNFTTFLCIGVVSEHKHILSVDASPYIYTILYKCKCHIQTDLNKYVYIYIYI